MLASVVTHGGITKTAQAAMGELRQALDLFDRTSKHGGRAVKFLVCHVMSPLNGLPGNDIVHILLSPSSDVCMIRLTAASTKGSKCKRISSLPVAAKNKTSSQSSEDGHTRSRVKDRNLSGNDLCLENGYHLPFSRRIRARLRLNQQDHRSLILPLCRLRLPKSKNRRLMYLHRRIITVWRLTETRFIPCWLTRCGRLKGN